MLTSLTESIPMILIGESSRRAVVFMVELLRVQPLSPSFMNSDIFVGLLYENTAIGPTVVQRLDKGKTLYIKKLCQTLHMVRLQGTHRM